MLSSNSVFLFQMLGIIFAGGFIGEYYRSAHSSVSISPNIFISNMLAGCFLTILVCYAFYRLTENKGLTFIIGGMLSYQEQQYISNLTRKIINGFIEGVKE